MEHLEVRKRYCQLEIKKLKEKHPELFKIKRKDKLIIKDYIIKITQKINYDLIMKNNNHKDLTQKYLEQLIKESLEIDE